MVRLKVAVQLRVARRARESFNPTVVRLKEDRRHNPVTHFRLRFNPTVVRLKVTVPEVPSGEEKGFNPTVVRLKGGGG